jgi:hypothetical protein
MRRNQHLSSRFAGWKAQERELPTAAAEDPSLILRSRGARE